MPDNESSDFQTSVYTDKPTGFAKNRTQQMFRKQFERLLNVSENVISYEIDI